MQVIEEIIYQKTAQGLDWLFSVWWYWLPAGIGFLFRFGLLKYKICNMANDKNKHFINPNTVH